MKILFDENGYNFVEIIKSDDGVKITLSAQDSENPLKTTINSVQVTDEQFVKLMTELGFKKE